MADEAKPVTRRTRPHPRSYRLSDEDVETVQALAEQEQLPQSAVVHLAIRDYGRKHLKRGKEIWKPTANASRV
jgi:predicted transcriptional regulator